MYVCIYVYLYIYTYMHAHTSKHVCIYVYMYTCMHVYMYTCLYTYRQPTLVLHHKYRVKPASLPGLDFAFVKECQNHNHVPGRHDVPRRQLAHIGRGHGQMVTLCRCNRNQIFLQGKHVKPTRPSFGKLCGQTRGSTFFVWTP